MSDKGKIAYLLQEVKRLEELLTGIQNAEIYPVSFFNESFDLTRSLLKDLYELEKEQVETLCKQMELRKALLQETLLQMPEQKIEEATLQACSDSSLSSTPIPSEVIETEIIKEEVIMEQQVEEPEEIIEFTVPEVAVEEIEEIREGKSIEELLKESAPQPQPLIPEKNVTSLSDIIEKKQLSDFRKAFSLNDRFYFRKELFNGDDSRMNEVITDLNNMQSLEESIDYLNNKMRWNPEDKPVADFIHLLEKRFL